MLWESSGLCNLPNSFSALFSYSLVRKQLMQEEIDACVAYHKQQVIQAPTGLQFHAPHVYPDS